MREASVGHFVRTSVTAWTPILLKPGAVLGAAELLEHCRKQIAGYKCPKSVEFVQELPRLPSGKINKVGLRRTYAPTADGEHARAAP